MLQTLREKGFDVLAKTHADGILLQDFPDELGELVSALPAVQMPVSELIFRPDNAPGLVGLYD